MYQTEIQDLETAVGILLAFDCPATAGNLVKVVQKLKALSADSKVLSAHWELQA
jgi:hypothetical protein